MSQQGNIIVRVRFVKCTNPKEPKQRMSLYIYIWTPQNSLQKAHSNRPHISKAPQFLFKLTLSQVYMSKSSSISFIFILVPACFAPTFEARKILSLKKGEAFSMEESLKLASSLPKGHKPTSSSSSSSSSYDKGHALFVNINGRRFTLHLPGINDHRALYESVPSPRVGHMN